MGICHTAMTVKQQSQKNTGSTKTRIPFLLVIPMIPGSPENYEKLSVTEKQQALLQGAVLEDSSLPETDLTFDDKKADFTLEAGKGCKIKDGKIIVAKEGATVQIGYQESRRLRFILWQKSGF